MVDAIVDNKPIRELSSQKTSYTNNSFSVNGEDSIPNSITWNDTGTKLFMVGTGSNTVHEYTASTAYDVATLSYTNISYTNNSFSVSGEDGGPNSITWNDTGTKLFMLGEGSNTVYEYTASTAYDVTTLSYTNNSFSVSGQDTNPNSITWNDTGTKDTGTKLFMLGGDTVHEYTASTAYDVTTLSYTNNDFNVGGDDTTPNSITWNDTGTKLFMVGESSNTVHEYTASTAYDVTTLSYTNNSFSVSGQDTTPTSITWNDTGTKLFMVGWDSRDVHEYTTAKYALGKTIEVPQDEVWRGELSNINKVIFNGVEITPPTNFIIADGDVLEMSENALFTGFRVK